MVFTAGTAIAIVTVISVTSTNPGTAEVIRIQSSLTATGREHACPDEPIRVTCEVNGRFIQWTFNAFYRSTFFHDQGVNSVQTVSGQHGVRAVLTGNDPIPNSPNADIKHLSSALIIQSSARLSGYLHNVSCSSDTETHTQQLKVAETPSVPLNVQVNGLSVPFDESVQLLTPCGLSVSWDPPDNSKKFDLDHFKVHIMLPEQESYITNGTSMEPEYYFHLDHVMLALQNSVHVMITVAAVSKCSQQGHMHSGTFPVVLNREVNNEVVLTNVPDVVCKTEGPKEYISMMNGYKEVIANEHKVILAFVLAMSILFHHDAT